MLTMRRLIIASAVFAAFVVCALATASAHSTFSIDPLLIQLDADNRNAVMTITNTSAQELRFEIKAYTWDQTPPDGTMKLTPTTDVVVFPPLRVRIGSDVAQGSVEKAYRLMIEELPNGTAPKTGSQVAVRTRVGVPVFLEPTKPVRSGRIDQVTMNKGVVSIPLTNTGTIYAMVDDVSVRGMSAPDAPVFEESLKGWYVLAGKTRTWTYTILPAQCKSVKFLEIEVSAHDKTLTQRFDLPAGACAR
jgi:P pilus assembly chaperone PapD